MDEKVVNIIYYLRNIPIFKGNPLSVNVLLFLFISGYFIVGHDLSKEMAKEKNEIDFFLDSLENSVHTDTSDILILLETIPPGTYIVPAVSAKIYNSDLELFPPGRSPPES